MRLLLDRFHLIHDSPCSIVKGGCPNPPLGTTYANGIPYQMFWMATTGPVLRTDKLAVERRLP